MMHYESEKLLKKYLLESGDMTKDQYSKIDDGPKAASVAFVAREIMGSLKDKVPAVDSQDIDRSRGDLKMYKDYPAIQAALSKLKSSVDGVSEYFGQSEASQAVADIIECLSNISKHSNDFKEAYRDKKTAVILQYEALMVSVIQSMSYLIATCTEAAKGDDSPVEYPQISKIRPLKAIHDFNDSCRTGAFDAALKDVTYVREAYVEHGIDVLSTITEASNVGSAVVDGFNNFVDAINGGNRKLTDTLYKSAAAVSMMMALRDSVYTASKIKNAVSDALGNIKAYADGFAGSILSKIKNYNAHLPQEIEVASTQAGREIEAQDREIKDSLKTISTQAPAAEPAQIQSQDDAKSQPQAPATPSALGF